MYLMKEIQLLLREAALLAFKTHVSWELAEGFTAALAAIEVTPATQEKFGHFQCNNAMKWSKILQLAPKSIAERWAEALIQLDQKTTMPLLAKVEVAGPGFINLSLSSAFVLSRLSCLCADPHLGFDLKESKDSRKQKIVLDFSSPNIAKEMHVGHLRTTIIGDCLARVMEWAGHEVLRLNHVGDWGTQFGMLIAYIQKEHAQAVENHLQGIDISMLAQWYKASKALFDEDMAFKALAHQAVVNLQRGQDPQTLEIWNQLCCISREAFQVIYDLLGIQIVERGESFYNGMLADVVNAFLEENLLIDSDGAACVMLDGFFNKSGDPLPLIVRKADGGYNYATTDLAAIRHRVVVEQADKILYVVDAGQSLHLEMVFQAAAKAGFYDPVRTALSHVPFGLVLGSDGKKFKTRSGDTEKLIDLIHGAIQRAGALIEARGLSMSAAEQTALSEIIGVNAIKYADLSCNRTQDYVFSYEKMLQFEGNTAVFLMYAYVRIQGIKRKALNNGTVNGIAFENLRVACLMDLHEEHELALALHLIRFPDIIHTVLQDYFPSHLTDYLYKLAEKFHAFFHHCRVEGSDQAIPRLMLCEIVARVLKTGMDLLGLKSVEKM